MKSLLPDRLPDVMCYRAFVKANHMTNIRASAIIRVFYRKEQMDMIRHNDIFGYLYCSTVMRRDVEDVRLGDLPDI